MAKNKNKSEKREKKKKLAEDEADIPVSKKKKLAEDEADIPVSKKKKLAEDEADIPVSIKEKKKKKKQIAKVPEESDTERSQVTPEDPIEDLTPEELRVLERKLKKERKKEEKKLKREQEKLGEETKEEPTKSTAGELALEYLTRWSKKHPEWKFQKLRQTWLLMNMYDPEKIPDKHFKRLLKYLQGLKGSARETTIQKAEEYMKESDSRETQDEGDEHRMSRIREVLQLLS